MSQKQILTVQDFSRYDRMTSGELTQFLRLDSEGSSRDQLDIDALLYITDILASREKNTGKTAGDAWDSFKRQYWPSEADPVFSVEEMKPAQPPSLRLRRVMVAVAAVALIVCIPLTAKALKWEKIRNTIATWADGKFYFTAEVLNPLDSLRQAMAENGDNSSMLPKWIPEGFVLDSIDVMKNPIDQGYVAFYKNGERNINFVGTGVLDSPLEKCLASVLDCRGRQSLQTIAEGSFFGCLIS